MIDFDRISRARLPALLRTMPKAELHIHIEGLSRARADLQARPAQSRGAAVSERRGAARGLCLYRFVADQPRGVVLVTGPTGSGKSTTLAAMVNYVNESRHDAVRFIVLFHVMR